jgi:hypothetical protein
MSSQQFNAEQREAIWLAHGKKCAYTREPLDVSNFHIDHVIPEHLVDDPGGLDAVKVKFGLPVKFDIFGYENLLPCRPGANLQKAAAVLDPPHTHFFLGIAQSKKHVVEAHLANIKKRNSRGKALILLQQCLENGQLDASEVGEILDKYADQPDEIFHLLEGMKFADATEIRAIAKADIEELRDRPIRLGQNDHIDGVTLMHENMSQVHVRTCREYNDAIKAGFYAQSTFDMKMATFFEHQCGLLTALEAATTPEISFIASPKVGIIDLELLPFSLFPHFGDRAVKENHFSTYQSKVSDGTIAITKLRQNLLQVAEPEGMGQQLIEVARADFNGDGIEEILVFEYCWATHGTLGYGDVKILTRKSTNSPFELVNRDV